MLNFNILHSYRLVFILCVCIFAHVIEAGILSCTQASTCTGGAIAYRMSGTSNAHAELATSTNYTQLVCCTGITGLSNTCSGTFATVLKLSSTTNAHVEQNSLSNYTNNTCLSVPTGGNISIGYRQNNCTGFDTTLGSMSSTTNAHVGSSTEYTTKICGSGSGINTISFSISDNTIGFGNLLTSSSRYATGDTLGTSVEADAHTISVSSNADGGYVVTVTGTTLTYASSTIAAIGAIATAATPGTAQFGIRAAPNIGTGVVSSPYNTSNWAFDTASFPDTVLSGAGDTVTTTFGMRYIANVSNLTSAGIYSTALTYTVTGSF